MDKLWVVIKREYLERVRSRWFIFTTIFGSGVLRGDHDPAGLHDREGDEEREGIEHPHPRRDGHRARPPRGGPPRDAGGTPRGVLAAENQGRGGGPGNDPEHRPGRRPAAARHGRVERDEGCHEQDHSRVSRPRLSHAHEVHGPLLRPERVGDGRDGADPGGHTPVAGRRTARERRHAARAHRLARSREGEPRRPTGSTSAVAARAGSWVSSSASSSRSCCT